MDKCTSCMDLTDIGETYDMKEMFAERRAFSLAQAHVRDVDKEGSRITNAWFFFSGIIFNNVVYC